MPDRMTFQFLDVGMGDGTLVQIRTDDDDFDRLMLVDFGERRSPFEIAHEDALAYLVEQIDENSRARRWPTPYVDMLVLTHPDGDHYNKITALLDATYPRYPTRRLRFGDLYYAGNASEYGRVISRRLAGRVVAANGLAPMLQNYHSPLDADDELVPWRTYGDVRVYVLSSNWPTRRDRNKNRKSVVLMFELDGTKVILPGDATRATENHILRDVVRPDPTLLSCHALKLGHHGSNGSTGDAWVTATAPLAVFASGDQVWAHPYCRAICKFITADTLQTYFADDSYYTCGDGNRYYNNATRLAICMNLWYFVQRRRETLTDEATGNTVTAARGTCHGVQWELSIDAGEEMVLSRTDTFLPRARNVRAPFVCAGAVPGDGRRDELLALVDALPPATDPAPA